jgi:hypothetical protein
MAAENSASDPIQPKHSRAHATAVSTVLKEEMLSTSRLTPIPGRNGLDSIRDLREPYKAARRAAEAAAADLAPMQTRVPYPLSRSFFADHNAFDAHERRDRVRKVGEALTKYLGALAVAAGGARSVKLRDLLDELVTYRNKSGSVAPLQARPISVSPRASVGGGRAPRPSSGPRACDGGTRGSRRRSDRR